MTVDLQFAWNLIAPYSIGKLASYRAVEESIIGEDYDGFSLNISTLPWWDGEQIIVIYDHADPFTSHLISAGCSLVFAVAIVEDSQLCFIVILFVIFIGIKHRLLKFINLVQLLAKVESIININKW